MSSFHRRKIRTGLGDRQKRTELNKLLSQSRKEELLDSKRGVPLSEVNNDGATLSGEVKATNNRITFFQRIHNWHKSVQKLRFKKCASSSGKSTSCQIEDNEGQSSLFPLQNKVIRKENESMHSEGLMKSEIYVQQTTLLPSQEDSRHGFHWSQEKVEHSNTGVLKMEEEHKTGPRDEADGSDHHQDLLATSGVVDNDQKDSSVVRLWSQQSLVIASGILRSLSSQQLKYQEAMYELMTSEQTYLSSLDVLIQHFLEASKSPPPGRCANIMDQWQHRVIYSNVSEVRDASSAFLATLEERQRVGVVIAPISDIILEYMRNRFQCYVRYCTSLPQQMQVLQELCDGSEVFRQTLEKLQTDGVCQKMSLNSYLLLPMQRVTRLPLLVAAILKHSPPDQPHLWQIQAALAAAHSLVDECNCGARHTEELHAIYKKLDFGKLEPFSKYSRRSLEKQGTLVCLQVEHKLLGQDRFKRKPYIVFVFSDYIVIAKKKDCHGEEFYSVRECVSRGGVKVELINVSQYHAQQVEDQLNPFSQALVVVAMANAEHAMLLTTSHCANKDGYILLADSEYKKCLERLKWLIEKNHSVQHAEDVRPEIFNIIFILVISSCCSR